jgi:hypothetical protein
MSKPTKLFPTVLLVVRDEDGESHYFIASETEGDCDVKENEPRIVATYELVKTTKVVRKVELVEVK